MVASPRVSAAPGSSMRSPNCGGSGCSTAADDSPPRTTRQGNRWPIGSKTSGDGNERFRIWPLYGQSELEGEFRKKFILWPIYNSVEYTNDRNPGGGFILVPVYGRIVTERASNYWLVPPFFRYMNSDIQWIVHAPWPFIQLADGEMRKRVFWPLYGKKSLGTPTRQYFFWPFIWNNRTQYARHHQHLPNVNKCS